MLGRFSPQLQPLCPAHAILCLSYYSLHDDQLLVRPCVAPFIVQASVLLSLQHESGVGPEL